MIEQLGSVIREQDDPRLAYYQRMMQQRDPRSFFHLEAARRELSLPEIAFDEALALVRRLPADNARIPVREAACVFIACRLHGVPRTARQISKFFGCRPFQTVRLAYAIAEAQGLEVRRPNFIAKLLKTIDDLRLPRSFYYETLKLLRFMDETNPTGQLVESKIAGILYGLCVQNGIRCTQGIIAKSLGIAEYTVRLASADFRRWLATRGN